MHPVWVPPTLCAGRREGTTDQDLGTDLRMGRFFFFRLYFLRWASLCERVETAVHR